uniref:Uncharacterized protein LOC102804422 n=1 Tax=Saccoglossus kowalevskii TaxID=10224 RepID=A0ABM0MQ15_SACKO
MCQISNFHTFSFLYRSAGFCFIFACFYMFLTTFPFLIGAPLQKFVCKPILSGDLWEQTIDNYDGWSEGYFLGDLVFQNSSIELTMTGVLKDCGDNKTPYKALKLDNLNLLDQYLDFEQYLNASEFDDMKNVDFSNIEIMSDETEDNLNDFKNAGVQNIDWTAYEAELNDDLTDYGDDLTGFADLIKKYIDDNNVP